MSMNCDDRPHELASRVAAELARLFEKPLAPGLHLVATPIGNLGDITLRALATLAGADVIYCEDTRHSRTLITHFGLVTRLKPYHEHNADAERPRVLEQLAAGGRVALISDAGTPLISDPGYKLVREAVAAGHTVTSLPGPCAAVVALTLAGLPTDCFLFAGFLPAKAGQRRSRLETLREVPATLVFYEAPSRVGDTLADLAAVLGDRPAVVARELTKLHETVARGPLSKLHDDFADVPARGEFVIVVAPPVAGEVGDDEIVAALRVAKKTQSTRDAVREVADRLAVARGRVYNLATLIEHKE